MPNLSLQLDWTENCVLVYTKAVSFSTQSCFSSGQALNTKPACRFINALRIHSRFLPIAM